MQKILIIEDDPAIQRGLVASFEKEHYDVKAFSDGEKGYQQALIEQFDIILLDLVLPGRNGEDVCSSLRHKGVGIPILMLTSRDTESDKILGLEIGADDYMTKPFSVPELLARVKALLRRPAVYSNEPKTFAFGPIVVDLERKDVYREENQLKFSLREFEVLRYFILHEGQLVTREDLLNHVWGYDSFPTTRTVDNFILAIRKKIEPDFSRPQHLVTAHTVGYKFIKEPVAKV